jgi:hypothetical protein
MAASSSGSESLRHLAWRISRTIACLFQHPDLHLVVLDYLEDQDGSVEIDQLCRDTRMLKRDAEKAVAQLDHRGLLQRRLRKKKPIKQDERLFSKSIVGRQREVARKNAPDQIDILIDPRSIHDNVTCLLAKMRETVRSEDLGDQHKCDSCGHRVKLDEVILQKMVSKDIVDKTQGDALLECLKCNKGHYRGGGDAPAKPIEMSKQLQPVSRTMLKMKRSPSSKEEKEPPSSTVPRSVTASKDTTSAPVSQIAVLNQTFQPISDLLLRLRRRIRDDDERRRRSSEQKDHDKKKKKKDKSEDKSEDKTTNKPTRTKDEMEEGTADLNKAIPGLDLAAMVEDIMEKEALEQKATEEEEERRLRDEILDKLRRDEEKIEEVGEFASFDDDDLKEDGTHGPETLFFSVQGVPRDFSWSTEEEQQTWLNQMTNEERDVYDEWCLVQQQQ